MDRNARHTALAFSVLLVPYLWLVQRWWFVCDDAFITFRFSRNLAMGNGPRYNLGEHLPVEGYSNFLWMLIAAGMESVGAEPWVWMPVLSVCAGIVLLGMVYRTLLVHVGTTLQVAWVCTLILAVFPPFAVWSTSGLATMPQALGMFAVWTLLANGRHPHAAKMAGVAALLLALVRTEGMAWAIIIGVIAITQRMLEGRSFKRELATYAAIAVSGYAVYFAWRYSYYQSLVANTALAKVHLQPSTLVRGVEYVLLYATTLLSPILLIGSVVLAYSSKRVWLAMGAGLIALGVPAYAVAVSGDYMTWFRILMPGAAFMAVSFGAALQVLSDKAPERTQLVLGFGVAVAVLGALPGENIHLVPESARKAYHVRDKLGFFRTENEQWRAMVNHVETWREKGEALATYATEDDSYVAAAIGATGYFSNVFIYDRNGLVNREVAMQPWNGQLRSPGHDKVVHRSFFYDKKPTILDSKVVTGPAIKSKLTVALHEMEAEEVRDNYYPELVPMPTPTGRKVRRFFLPLRRATSTDQAAQGWETFREATADFRG